MSHFSVIVIGPNVDAQLGPYHEFESTGRDDQYVQSIDVTEDRRREYASETVTRLRDATGALYSPSDPRFYRDPTVEELSKIGLIAGTGWGHGMSWASRDWSDGRGYRAKIRFTPAGFTEVTVPIREVMTFTEFCIDWHGDTQLDGDTPPDLTDRHKYGHVRVDSSGEVLEVIDRTNPHHKWDWYTVGGRWAGAFHTASGRVDSCRWGDVLSPSDVRAPFAIVKDGQWFQRGEMGWWGAVRNETDSCEWDAHVRDILAGLFPDDTVTIVDCHT